MTRDAVCRIAAFSGYTGDKFSALKEQAEDSGAPILFGDYLAEMNIAWQALAIKADPTAGYEAIFLQHLRTAAKTIAANKQRVLTNAGALNPKGLAEAVAALLKEEGVSLKVAYVQGDNILARLPELVAKGETFHHLESDDRHLADWKLKDRILSANAYVGARGVRAALEAGADIVITGRVTDASPVIAAAAWWHNWGWDEYDKLAGGLLAGHCIECGAYVTGGNSSGFLAYKDEYYDIVMGIAEIEASGEFVITKQTPRPGQWNGVVNDVTVRSQILYEIQGNVYLNPDVQALLDTMTVRNEGPDRVRVAGVTGIAPPDTTKIAICAMAGYQAEAVVYACGLDVEEKFDTLKLQITHSLGGREAIDKRFTTFDMTQYGVAAKDATTEAAATAMLRIFAQAESLDAFGPARSLKTMINPEGLGHFPGFHFPLTHTDMTPVPYIEYWPGRVRQHHIPLTVGFVGSEKVLHVPAARADQTRAVLRSDDYDAAEKLVPSQWGTTTRGPIGLVVHARSGDKGGNANVGFFVRHEDEYPWLRALLSKAELIRLMGDEYVGNRIERVELPGLKAVHFVIHDYLGKGVSSTWRLDSLAKGVAEYLRSKYVDVPDRFLVRGKI
ncbi:hypothetical protein VHUM_03769 [Vanrija humicola]|uniref:DUF1446 domain-containing protein n=1 Tax=Vanrija humicola TaxID=5417 RepID=A0A7D8Z6H1_VANHU|nr:hypothetical protein VHUM_03769 [Vanrija humicola]